MKKVNVFFAGVFFLLFSISANTQTNTGADFFTGKWNVLAKGTPDRDRQMIVSFEKKDSTMTGVIQDTTGVEMYKVANLEIKENQVTVYFTSQGFDVPLFMEKKGDNHLTGNVMGMFDVEGVHIKENKQ
jgi:hypothetical protein